MPEIPGLETFAGETYFSARWPHHPVDFAGKRVGVIGTGSTGIQIIPEVAREAKHLFVFQRTASFTLPARNRPLDSRFTAEIKARYPEHRELARQTPSGGLRPITDRPAFSVPDGERQEIYEDVWQRGGLNFFASFGDLLTNEKANETAADFVHTKISQTVRDPRTADLLKPHGYPLGRAAHLSRYGLL
ncbi:MAG: hypothetical protein WDN03_07260 [Rhizomicrobium sp.]